jgi:S-adenosylmethionine hydrolase
VGPDNGVLGALATHADAEVVVLDRTALHRTPTAPTFHGRDIFAPVAAELAMGVPLAEVGTRIADATPSTLPKPVERGAEVHGVTLGADRYGNLTTNVPAGTLVSVTAGGTTLRIVRTYSDAKAGELVALIGSDGYVELAKREASAAEELGAHGTAIVCRRA